MAYRPPVKTIGDNKLYKLKRAIGLKSGNVTSPGLIVGSALREGIRRSKEKFHDVLKDVECIS